MEVNLTFGAYTHPLKTLFKQGLLPQVQYGLYGEHLTRNNISIEHLTPFAKSHRTNLGNIALASSRRNVARRRKPLWEIENIAATAKQYINQFDGIHIPGQFDGKLYKRLFINKLRDLGIDLDLGIIFRNKPKTYRKPANFLRHG